MRQAGSDFKQDLAAETAFPTAEPTLITDGVDVEPGALMRVAKVLVKVLVGGTGTIKVSIRGRDRDGDWGVVGENGGFVNLGAALAARAEPYYFFLRDVGVFNRFAAIGSDESAAAELSVWFAAVMERGD
jgi:hypothetical protein